MTSIRFTFAGGPGDFTIVAPSTTAGVVNAYANAHGTAWSQSAGGTQYTDLLPIGTGPAPVQTDANGFIYDFQGPAGITILWVDFGAGQRFPLIARELVGILGGDGYVNPAMAPALLTTSAAAAGYVAQGQMAVDLAKQTGVDVTGATDCGVAVQTALDSAVALGARVFGRGTILTSTTLTIKGAADLGDLTVNYTGTGTAVQVGDPSSLLWRKIITLPRVVATAKTVVGWAQVAGSIGVRVTNAYSCTITIPHVTNFETGLWVHGQYPNGSSYNTLNLGHLDNNKVNCEVMPQDSGSGATSGWANQNTVIGGRMSHNSNEGPVATGTRHVLIPSASNAVNNNQFYGTSLESPNVVEYHVEVAGWYNYFDRCRWENTTPANRRIHWLDPAQGNIISGGMYASSLVVVNDSANTNEIKSDAAWTSYTPVWTSSSTAPVIGNGTLTGRYKVIDSHTVHYEILLIVGSTTTFGAGFYYFTLPFAHQNANPDALGVMVGILGSSPYTGGVAKALTTTIRVVIGSAYLSGTVPATLVSGNTISISGTYERA